MMLDPTWFRLDPAASPDRAPRRPTEDIDLAAKGTANDPQTIREASTSNAGAWA